MRVAMTEHAEHHRPSLATVLKGVVGLSFLATVGFGALAPQVGYDPSEWTRALVTFAGAAVGGYLAWRS
ncbi:hypothetical protein HL658_29205 [Azospirillum sp. RWY-5-1]|uniref:Uncharacterized protein n=1 Tax=Azospirillum oleiclasticum TaxID=2735135 RepID=A0ABX2TK85_9PROT|nr:hypothetical protein [Azospirillum oleiclasticum]NYZ16643.1 hypothetical protein [Azospirillum oleiclasticum]NYZ24130.1 hypothetical protein [Azospirillum oleiclasticum]